jgi:hypothetical protein
MARPRHVPVELRAANDDELLVAVLDEVVFLLDADRGIVVGAHLGNSPSVHSPDRSRSSVPMRST